MFDITSRKLLPLLCVVKLGLQQSSTLPQSDRPWPGQGHLQRAVRLPADRKLHGKTADLGFLHVEPQKLRSRGSPRATEISKPAPTRRGVLRDILSRLLRGEREARLQVHGCCKPRLGFLTLANSGAKKRSVETFIWRTFQASSRNNLVESVRFVLLDLP